jgi:hypothetical protein
LASLGLATVSGLLCGPWRLRPAERRGGALSEAVVECYVAYEKRGARAGESSEIEAPRTAFVQLLVTGHGTTK